MCLHLELLRRCGCPSRLFTGVHEIRSILFNGISNSATRLGYTYSEGSFHYIRDGCRALTRHDRHRNYLMYGSGTPVAHFKLQAALVAARRPGIDVS